MAKRMFRAVDSHCGIPACVAPGTVFTGELLEETQIHGRKTVVPTIGGRGWITSHSTVALDSSDPFPEGYAVGDIWG